MKIKKYIVTAIIIILFAVFFSPQDVLLVKGERKNILVFPYKDKIDFTFEYTHSFPVIAEFRVEGDIAQFL